MMKNVELESTQKYSKELKRTPNSKKTRSKQRSGQSATLGSKFPQDTLNPRSKFNDVSWYAKNQQMLADAASYSYNQPLGSPITNRNLFVTDISNPTAGVRYDTTVMKAATSIPGVMSLYTCPMPGLSTSYRSPLNLAAQNIYSFVRYKNSGSKNYDPADLMMYLQSLDSSYACWNFYKRLYGLVRSYDQNNWYMPKALVEAAGVDFDDLKDHLADFRLYLNVTGARLSSFNTPATMPIFVRHSWMFANVWADASQKKAQLYQFAPLYFYRYEETTNPQGTQLTPVPFITFSEAAGEYPSHQTVSQKTVAQLKSYLDSLIDALASAEDIGVMSGDIEKAYGESGLFRISPVPEDYSLTPVYNEEVLGQIHNATIPTSVYNPADIDSFVVTQDVNSLTIRCNPVLNGDRQVALAALVNTQKQSVTPADTMVNTRLTAAWTGNTAAGTRHFTACGTEIIYMAGITFYDATNPTRNPFVYTFKTFPTCILDSVSSSSTEITVSQANSASLDTMYNVLEYFAMFSLLSQFDWAPIVRPVVETAWTKYTSTSSDISARDYYHPGFFGDVSNWTVIQDEDLQNLHLTAVMSEYDIPAIGSF